MIRVILEVLAGLLRFVPGFRDRKIGQLETAWRENRKSIDTDLGPKPWWVRHDSTAGNEYDRGR